jgi:hypothetical protein
MTRPLLAVLLLLAAAPAIADEVAEARAQFDAGAKLFHAGKYREAIARFEAAYRQKPHGAIHFNVAQCRERLGEWPAALRSYQDYLRELPEARDRAAVRADIGRIEQRLAGAGVQALLVYSDPPGAALRLDGKARGRTPFLITLPPGAYRVTLSLDGFATEEQEVEVNLAASRLVESVLRPQAARAGAARSPPAAALGAPAASLAAGVAAAAEPPDPANRAHASALSSGVPVAAATTASPAGPPDLSPSPPAASPLGAPVPPEPAPSRGGWTARRIAAWATAVAAVVAVGAGVSAGVQAKDASSQLRDGTVRSSADADALARDAKAKARSANTLYLVGGAAAAASTTLFVLEGRF